MTATAAVRSHAAEADHSHFSSITVAWGIVVGVVNAAAPLAMWWLDPATVHALAITLIASVYIGFAVADGRPRVIALECGSRHRS